MKTPNHIGERFGKWTVLDPECHGSGSNIRLKCGCDCGTERLVLRASLRYGVSTNCGCERYARFGQRARARILQHGMSKTKVFRAWSGARNRCIDPKNVAYRNYGDRGISMCRRWLESFEAFLADMGQPPSMAHSLDRIDVNGDYEPGNCRWATRKEQMRNTRRNRFVEIDSERYSVAEWCERLGIPIHSVKNRVNAGMTYADAIRDASRRRTGENMNSHA